MASCDLKDNVDYTLVNNKNSDKSVYLVKLTDSALKAIDVYLRNKVSFLEK